MKKLDWVYVFIRCPVVITSMWVSHIFSYRTEKDKAPPSPYLTINNKGDVEVQNDQVLVSTCRMHIYQFPFDTQSCNLSFKSVIHAGDWCMSWILTSWGKHIIFQYMCVYFLSTSSFTSHLSQRHPSPGKRQLLRGHRVVSWGDEDSVRMAVHQHDSYHQKRHWFRGPRHHCLHCMFN